MSKGSRKRIEEYEYCIESIRNGIATIDYSPTQVLFLQKQIGFYQEQIRIEQAKLAR